MASDEISILVVEDEPAIAELIAFSVKSAGWRPVTVFSGNDAWTALQRFRPDVPIQDHAQSHYRSDQQDQHDRRQRPFHFVPLHMLV